MKKSGQTITLSSRYQWLFTGAVIGSWLLDVLLELQSMTHDYTSDGTWAFQLSFWGFPVLLFLLSLGFAIRPYRLWVQRLFFTTFLTTVAMAAYDALNVADNLWYTHIYSPNHPLGADASYWQAFGNEWLVMAVTLIGYCAFLFYLGRRKS